MTSLCQCYTVYWRWGHYSTTDITTTNAIAAARIGVPCAVLWYRNGVVSTEISAQQSLSFGSICINSNTCVQMNCSTRQRPCMMPAWSSYRNHKSFSVFFKPKGSVQYLCRTGKTGWKPYTWHFVYTNLGGSCSVHHLSGLGRIPIWPFLFLMYRTHLNVQCTHGSDAEPTQAICGPWTARQISEGAILVSPKPCVGLYEFCWKQPCNSSYSVRGCDVTGELMLNYSLPSRTIISRGPFN